MTTATQAKSAVEVFKEKLVETNHPAPDSVMAQLPADLESHPNSVQMFMINRLLRKILIAAEDAQGVKTFNARFSIVDEASVSDWSRSLVSGTLPLLAQVHG